MAQRKRRSRGKERRKIIRKRLEVEEPSETRRNRRELELQRLLDAGRVRRAYALAVKIAAETADGDVPRSVIQAHERRLLEMIHDSHVQEAAGLANKIAKNRPDICSQFSFDTRVLLACCGADTDIVTDRGADKEPIDAINASIRRCVFDPRILAHSKLSEIQSVRVDAEIVVDVWETIEAGEEVEIRKALRPVNRRSPLADWRLFVQALDAYYRADFSFARANIDRMDSDSAAAKPAAVLRRRLDGLPPRSTAEEKLCKAIAGDSLTLQLEQIDEALAQRKSRKAYTQLISLARRLIAEKREVLLTHIVAFLWDMELEDDGIEDVIDRVSSDIRGLVSEPSLFSQRLSALFNNDMAADWVTVLHAGHATIKPIHRALIYHRMARTIIRDLSDDIPFVRSESSRYNVVVQDFFQSSVKEMPLPEVYRDWLQTMSADRTQSRKILEDWHRDFPNDEEPVFALLQHARDSGSVRKALGYYEKIRGIIGNSPRIVQFESYLRLEQSISLFKRAKSVDVEKILRDVPDRPLEVAVARACLGWFHSKGDARIAYSARLADFSSPYLVAYMMQAISGASRTRLSLPVEVTNQYVEATTMVRSFVETISIADPVWSKARLPDVGRMLTHAAADESLRLPTIIGLLEAIHLRDPSLAEKTFTELIVQATANHFRNTDEVDGRIVLYRAIALNALSHTSWFEDRYHTRIKILCRAARQLYNTRGGELQFLDSTLYLLSLTDADVSTPLSKRSLDRLLSMEGRLTGILEVRRYVEGNRLPPRARKKGRRSSRSNRSGGKPKASGDTPKPPDRSNDLHGGEFHQQELPNFF